MKTKERIIVSAVLISKDNKLLLGKVRAGGVYPDCWHIPGGGVDAGEDKETALVREIWEEVGVNIKGISTVLLSDSDSGEAVKTDSKTGEKIVVKMHFNVYEVRFDKFAKDINITLNDDIAEYKWVSLGQLKEYKHTPPSEKLFKSLGWL